MEKGPMTQPAQAPARELTDEAEDIALFLYFLRLCVEFSKQVGPRPVGLTLCYYLPHYFARNVKYIHNKHVFVHARRLGHKTIVYTKNPTPILRHLPRSRRRASAYAAPRPT